MLNGSYTNVMAITTTVRLATTSSRMSLWLIFLVLSFPLVLCADYLYSTLPAEESSPVVEFVPPPAGTVLNRLDEDAAVRPNFLYSTEEGHRVVLYYLPWCPHCQAYVPTYIALARRVQEMINAPTLNNNNAHQPVTFYAISCLPNRQLCKDQHVSGVPGIKIFPAGSVDGSPADPSKLHPFQILRILGIPMGKIDEEASKTNDRSFLKGTGRAKSKKTTFYRRTRSDTFGDAYRSFHFAMKTGVFVENGALPESSQKALGDWILLLQNTLPPTWNIQLLLQDILDNFESITKDEDNLVAILEKHPPESAQWSYPCSKGEDGEGYTCGLWNLFHIMTLGVVEFNENAISQNELASYHTGEVADILRNYIEHFFSCEVCRSNFIKAYDFCAYDRCHRLVKVVGEKRNWIQLPLWLWEEHNRVNVRLLHEHAERSGKVISRDDEAIVLWPPRAECPNCWNVGGTSDEKLVYMYLLNEYWPANSSSTVVQRALFGSMDANGESYHKDSILAIPFALLLLPLMGPLCLGVIWFRKKLRKKRTGRLKKIDF